MRDKERNKTHTRWLLLISFRGELLLKQKLYPIFYMSYTESHHCLILGLREVVRLKASNLFVTHVDFIAKKLYYYLKTHRVSHFLKKPLMRGFIRIFASTLN